MSLSVVSIAFAALLIGVAAGALAIRALKSGRQTEDALSAVRSLDQRLDVITAEMNRTFAQALQQATQSISGTIGTVRDEARAVREETRSAIQQQSLQVAQTLGDLNATNNRILEQSRSLDEFQRMLQSPKLRGDFGEFTLEQMLRDLLPAEHYECQASIGTGRVDALIRTPYGSLCIDCKFPLDNFRRALQATRAGCARCRDEVVLFRCERAHQGDRRPIRVAAPDARRRVHVRAGRERLLRSDWQTRFADATAASFTSFRCHPTRCMPTSRRWRSVSAA